MTQHRFDDLPLSPLLRQLNPAKLTRLLEGAEEVRIPADITFLREGDSADVFYLIKSGSVQIFSGQSQTCKVIARETVGGFFGEQALLSPAPGRRNASVRTLTDCVFWAISHDKLRDLLRSEDTFKKELRKLGFEELLNRFKSANADADICQVLLEAADVFESRVFKDNETLFSEGEALNFSYFLLSGQVDIYKKNEAGADIWLHTLMPNSLFTAQSTTAKAKGTVTVLVIPNDSATLRKPTQRS